MSLLFNMLSRLEKQTSSKSGKEEVKAVYCPPAYLNYMQINHKKCWADQNMYIIKGETDHQPRLDA